MRTLFKSAVLSLVCIAVLGCAPMGKYRSTHILKKLYLGQTKQEVLMKLGGPDGAKADRNVEYLYYTLKEPNMRSMHPKVYFIKFVDNLVVKYGVVRDRDEPEDLL